MLAHPQGLDTAQKQDVLKMFLFGFFFEELQFLVLPCKFFSSAGCRLTGMRTCWHFHVSFPSALTTQAGYI